MHNLISTITIITAIAGTANVSVMLAMALALLSGFTQFIVLISVNLSKHPKR